MATTPPGLGSAAPEDGFFLADWELAICFSLVFFTIFPVVVVGVFFGLVRDTGLSTWKRREVKVLRLNSQKHKSVRLRLTFKQ